MKSPTPEEIARDAVISVSMALKMAEMDNADPYDDAAKIIASAIREAVEAEQDNYDGKYALYIGKKSSNSFWRQAGAYEASNASPKTGGAL